jgi:hypothetical protein
MAKEKVFPEGVRAFAPKTQYSKATVVIDVNKLFAWLKAGGKQHLTEYNGEKQLKLIINEGKSGGYYAEVDKWEPKPKDNSGPAGYNNQADDDGAPF